MHDSQNDPLVTMPVLDDDLAEDGEPRAHDATRDLLPPDGERRTRTQHTRVAGALPAGTRLGDYVLAEVLGRGGCATIYRAVQRRLGRAAVVKVAASDSADATVRREADMARQLQHPGLIHFYDAGQTRDGRCWLAMELVTGASLADKLADHTPMAFDAAMSVLLQLLDALATAHDQHIVHRDIKPGNVMLTRVGVRDDVVKLLDFGAAVRVNKLGQPCAPDGEPRSTMGTPRYMAPELLNGTSLPASDVYAAALVAVEMLTGLPYIGGNDVSMVLAHHLRGLRPLPAEVARLSIGPVLERALSRQPADRYPHARAFYDALIAATDRHRPLRSTSPALLTAFADFVDVVDEFDIMDSDDLGVADIELVETAPLIGGPHRARFSLSRVALLLLLLAVPMAAAVALGFWSAAGVESQREARANAATPTPPATATDTGPPPTRTETETETDTAPAPSPKVTRELARGVGRAATRGAAQAWRPLTTTWRLVTAPRGARVARDGEVLCEVTPCEIGLTFGARPQPVEIEVALDGYESAMASLAPGGDPEVHIALTRSQPRVERERRRARRQPPPEETTPAEDAAWTVLP